VILIGSKYEYTDDPSQLDPPYTNFTSTPDPAIEVGDEQTAREDVKTTAGLLSNPKKHQDLYEVPVKLDPKIVTLVPPSETPDDGTRCCTTHELENKKRD
jgi:hypothetical protein